MQGGKGNFFVATHHAVLFWADTTPITGVLVTNSTYAAISMRDGDQFAKKFGGESGDDPDFFRLVAHGYKDGSLTDSVEFFLADYQVLR